MFEWLLLHREFFRRRTYMEKELIDRLSIITEEERLILQGKKDIDKTIYTEQRDMVVDSEKLLQKGKLIQVRPHTRFVHFPRHRHNYVEVIYMCQGRMTNIIDGNEVLLQQGELLFLNQDATQEIYPAGKEDIAVNFIILPEFFDTAVAMMGGDKSLLHEFLIGSLRPENSKISYLHFYVADILPIQNLVENMVWTLLHDQNNKWSSNQITMGLLMLHLLSHMDKMSTGQKEFEREFAVEVLGYIESYYRKGSLQELSDRMGYEVSWMSREIKKQLGSTYKEILQNKRLNQAGYLLLNSRLSIASISEAVGYNNTSYFHRKFKERFGCSPKEYRERNR